MTHGWGEQVALVRLEEGTRRHFQERLPGCGQILCSPLAPEFQSTYSYRARPGHRKLLPRDACSWLVSHSQRADLGCLACCQRKAAGGEGQAGRTELPSRTVTYKMPGVSVAGAQTPQNGPLGGQAVPAGHWPHATLLLPMKANRHGLRKSAFGSGVATLGFY